jgi:hypothetical protein
MNQDNVTRIAEMICRLTWREAETMWQGILQQKETNEIDTESLVRWAEMTMKDHDETKDSQVHQNQWSKAVPSQQGTSARADGGAAHGHHYDRASAEDRPLGAVGADGVSSF